MIRHQLLRIGVVLTWLLLLAVPANAHSNISLTINSFTPTTGPAGTVTTVDFTYGIFHVGHNPAINNVWRILLDGVVVAGATNVHPNTGSGNEFYTENENVTIPLASGPGTYTITVQTLHSPVGVAGCSFAVNNTCRRQATLTFTIPDESDMTIDLSGLPASADINAPYSGTFTCTNDAGSNAPALSASCAVSGLPTGVSVTSCTPTPPATVAIGASITCNVSGTPTVLGAANVTGTTGATNDINGGTGTGGNNSANTNITVAGSDMSPDVSGLPTSANVGVPYAGTFTCSNAGPNTALNATCSASGLPAGVTVTSCTPTPPASVANGASITCNVAGTPTTNGTANVTATTGATNDINGGTGTGGNNQTTTTITVAGSDMSPDVSGLPTNANVGVPYAGTFTCSNAGPNTALNATCSASGLPVGVTVTSCTPTPPASVANGASITCNVAGTPTTNGTANVTATTGATNDINGGTGTGGNNQTTTTITVAGSDMSPDVSGLPTNTIVGVPYAGSFTCNNAGPDTALNATCSISGLPAGVTVTSCTPTPPASVANGGSITCNVAGTPTANTTANVTATTGATNDIDGGTGTGGNNQTSTTITASAIETTKTATATTNLGSLPTLTDAGDRVDYVITIQNTGTSTLTGVNVTDVLTRQGGGGLSLTSGPTFNGNSGGSPSGTLAPGESASFLASYTFVQADINAGGVSNVATGQATSPGGSVNDVTDVSDDGDDGDGNTINDPTVTDIAPSPSLAINKVANDDTLRAAGDIIVYTYTVTNTGNITINGVTISDTHNGSGPPPTPDNESLLTDNLPLGDSTDGGVNASWDSLAPGDVVRFTASYTVTQNDVDTLQ